MNGKLKLQRRIQKCLTLTCGALLFLCLCLFPTTSQADDKSRKRLEELFIWKLSDILALDAEQDARFRRLIHDLNKTKTEAQTKMRDSLKQLESEHGKEAQRLALMAYRQQLKIYLEVQNEELQKIEELLGAEMLATYLLTKAKLTENLKVMITNQGEKAEAVLEQPKIEVEK